MTKKPTKGEELLQRVKDKKNIERPKSFQKLVGKDKKDHGKFRYVNFNG